MGRGLRATRASLVAMCRGKTRIDGARIEPVRFTPFRKVGVAEDLGFVDVRDQHFVGDRHCKLVDLGAADDEGDALVSRSA